MRWALAAETLLGTIGVASLVACLGALWLGVIGEIDMRVAKRATIIAAPLALVCMFFSVALGGP